MSVPTLNPPDLPDERAGEMNRLGSVTGSRAAVTPAAPNRTAELASRLFRGPERWGWEFVEPAPAGPYPHLDGYPTWVEPLPPDMTEHQHALSRARAALGKRVAIAAGLLLVGVLMSSASSGPAAAFGVMVLLAGVSVGGFAAYAVVAPQQRMRDLAQQAQARRDAVHQNFREVCARWDEQIAAHDAAERTRVMTEPLLFPLAPRSAARVDVFGGNADGWAALLSTMGSSVLAEGSTLLLLDLSGQDVAGPLTELTQRIGGRTRTASVPADLDRPWLLGGLQARELAEVLAEAMDVQRGRGGAADLGAMDAELIHTVAQRLTGPVTFARLAAGIRVLRSTYEDDGALNAAEVSALTERVDLIDRSERMRDELGFVEAQLKILVDSERDADDLGGSATALWPDDGLGVVRSDEHNSRRKTFVDRVLFGAVAHHLATTRLNCPDPVLVVAGADEMGRDALESMARKASRARVRLVYLFEHLRDDAEELLGGGGSVAVLMRLGNGREAATAAEFVGRGHSFRLSQLSRQHGRNETVGTNRSTTTSTGGSEAVSNGGSSSTTRGGSSGGSGGGHNWGRNWSTGTTDTWSRTVTDTWSTAQQTGESFSQGWSENDGVVLQRSYEFRVEPSAIQTLEPTTFLVVDSGPEGRRVRMADCFPGSVYVPRISPAPR